MNDPEARKIKSFVLRQGRLTRGQENALEQYWPVYGLSLESGNPIEHFKEAGPVTLEIGFGMGDSLFEQASNFPARNFIGIEVHRPGVGHLLMLAGEAGLTNLRVYSEDSLEILQKVVPDGSLDVVQVFFPDPWPKKRHHKRRLINGTFLNLIAGKLKPGGLIHIATDWEPYAQWILEVFAERNDYTVTDAPERPKTKFEQRGVKLGHRIQDFAWRLSG